MEALICNQNFYLLGSFFSCTVLFLFCLGRNPGDKFSGEEAHGYVPTYVISCSAVRFDCSSKKCRS